MGSNGTLTFGVELEFLTPYVKNGCKDPRDGDPRHIPVEIPPSSTTNGLPPGQLSTERNDGISQPSKDPMRDLIVTQVFHTLQGHAGVPLRIAKTYPTHRGEDGIYREHRKWNLTEEESLEELDIGGRAPNEYAWVGVEVTSPICTAQISEEGMYMPRKSDRDDLATVCRVLRGRVRCAVNQGTGDHRVGMHVHIGRGGQGFGVLELKKFATLMWISEPVWMDLHANWRKGYRYARTMSTVSTLANLNDTTRRKRPSERYMPQMRELLPESMIAGSAGREMALLWGAETVDELVLYLCRNDQVGRMGFGFRELVDNPRKAKQTRQNTIEWRHMQGSLDPEQITQWTVVCLRMVQLAECGHEDEFKETIQGVHQGWLKGKELSGRYSATQFLHDIGLPRQAAYFESVKQRTEEEAIPTACEENNWKDLFLPPMGEEIQVPTADECKTSWQATS
ncbi:hypothetical protein MKZ38_008988 [Zalerion maritima]|uniref:Uncharacterized protein n=1 Tax=Zalerion maritima TaxID=339359 RepID=A0AAD5RKF2_9PEZI|nr:hypothetical protein MKZ38_008988 [Zalerion maritima]